jgi:hypothetical protein
MEIMEKLRQYIGKNVKCTYVVSGNVVVVEGVLEDVYDYFTVLIDMTTVPFAGIRVAMMSLECENEVIFSNPYVTPEYMGYGGEIEDISKKIFGRPWIRAFEKSMTKIDHTYEEYHVSEDWFIVPSRSDEEVIEYYNKYKKAYIIEGRNYIDDEAHKEEWANLCENVVGDREKIVVLNGAFALLRYLKRPAISLEDAINTVQQELDLDDQTLNWVVMNAGVYSSRSEELLIYWSQERNNRQGFGGK